MVLSLLQCKQTADLAHANGPHPSRLPGRLILELGSWNNHGMYMIHTIPVLQKYNDLINLFQADTPRRQAVDIDMEERTAEHVARTAKENQGNIGLIRTVSGHMSFHFKGSTQVSVIMPPSFPWILLLALSFLALMLQKSEGQFEEWCIADEQTPDDELQRAMDWACGKGGADCSKIQLNQPCYMPNTIRDHASYAFNNYYQKFKHRGATCYFNSAALITDLDPSQHSCKFEYLP
ncbi:CARBOHYDRATE-BINDING X8 DOMAIN SUPERFAMILY PROTEIN [Salix viminalis]|uniref:CARBOHYDRATE-BINDING X8 DOMAIN SUPERFAMILY PROTEIN n=5 Tax=Salix TaxID=40685 RepID=A0A9Q0V497_SALVM|nr:CARBOHYDRATE-BINDING X8 DOMAIN SUPERFAMILY PROTEIN [Salix viminalis]